VKRANRLDRAIDLAFLLARWHYRLWLLAAWVDRQVELIRRKWYRWLSR